MFTQWNELVFTNYGAADVTIQPAASNGANLLGLANGSPITVRAKTSLILQSVVGESVSTSHTGILITPAASGSLAVAIGGG